MRPVVQLVLLVLVAVGPARAAMRGATMSAEQIHQRSVRQPLSFFRTVQPREPLVRLTSDARIAATRPTTHRARELANRQTELKALLERAPAGRKGYNNGRAELEMEMADVTHELSHVMLHHLGMGRGHRREFKDQHEK